MSTPYKEIRIESRSQIPGVFFKNFSDNENPFVIKGTFILLFFAEIIISPILELVKGSKPPEIDSAEVSGISENSLSNVFSTVFANGIIVFQYFLPVPNLSINFWASSQFLIIWFKVIKSFLFFILNWLNTSSWVVHGFLENSLMISI